MPYLGQRPSKGDENNFKILDDISSYTLTFDGSDSSVVSAANDTITSLTHRFVQGQRVTYNNGGGSNIAGLTSGTVYYIIEPLPVVIIDPTQSATSGLREIRNPLIVQDEAEREAAQEVINKTPQAVIDSINT